MLKKPTKRLFVKEEYAEGANHPTTVTVHRCFCGIFSRGRIEHHRVSGFDDDFFVIACPRCRKKYDYISEMGYEWEVLERDPDDEDDEDLEDGEDEE